MRTRPVYLRDVVPRPKALSAWERTRNKDSVHWIMELFAEMFGVFLYVYFGVGSTIGWVIGNIIKTPLSSIFQIGFAYALGILFALTVCASTSGGHFNPCITITLTLFKGFPKAKAVRYIVAQILGAYIACLFVYGQWKVLIDEAEAALVAAGPGVLAETQFTPNGPPGAFALYLLPGQTMGNVFLNEFVNCTVIGIIIWACLDPTNFLVPPMFGPVVIALAYAAAIWGFATPGISLNAARDVGGRLMAMTIWGMEASGGKYAAIAALVNIPATLFAVFLYEIFLTDSDRPLTSSHLDHLHHHSSHARHGKKESVESGSSHEKGSIEEMETVQRV